MIDVFLDGVPIRRRSAALFDHLRAAIVEGRLRPGDQLPPSRDLAVELGVARSTIATVYARLVGEGYAEGRVGDGTFVTDYHTGSNTRTQARARTPTRCASPAASRPWAATLTPPPGGWRIDLRTGRPDPSLFPVVDWRRCATAALDQPPPGYGEPGRTARAAPRDRGVGVALAWRTGNRRHGADHRRRAGRVRPARPHADRSRRHRGRRGSRVRADPTGVRPTRRQDRRHRRGC